MPVLIHTAEPQEFFEPIDYSNERWLELALYSSRRYPPDQAPRFEELIAERDRMFAKHRRRGSSPRTSGITPTISGAWASCSIALPNVYTRKSAAILAELGRQPRTAHDFFVKYQDRILFGKDSYQPDEYPYYWRTFETADEYFDYYRDYHAFWKLYGMSLPDDVLKKLYYKNALTIVPGLPASAIPQLIWLTIVVTGGAGFIGSHLAEELARRGHRVRVADSLVTGKRSNLDHVPGVEFVQGDLADLEFARQRGRRRGLRAAPGGDAIRAAIGQGSDYVASCERRRHAERARRRARRRREARRLCRIVIGVRQHGDAAQARGDAEQARCRPTRCRRWWGSSISRCSRRSTGSRR